MEKQFRDASFMIFKVALRDQRRNLQEIKAIETNIADSKQRKIDLIMQCRQIQHDTIEMAKNEYPLVNWMKELGGESKSHELRTKFISKIVSC